MRMIRGGKTTPEAKVVKALNLPKIEVERGAGKLDKWLDKQRGVIEQAGIDHKAANPDRYFVAFATIWMPIATSSAWPSKISDTLLFEQPEMPSMDQVINTAKQCWGIARAVDVLNFYELSADDYQAFLGDESEWSVIDE